MNAEQLAELNATYKWLLSLIPYDHMHDSQHNQQVAKLDRMYELARAQQQAASAVPVAEVVCDYSQKHECYLPDGEYNCIEWLTGSGKNEALITAGTLLYPAPTPTVPADVMADAERWRMLPAFIEEFQIEYVPLLRAIDAARAAKSPK